MDDLFARPLEPTQGARRGNDGSVEWTLWAPLCDHVSLLLWPGGKRVEQPMQSVGRGYFRIRGPADEGARYAYRLPHGGERPDPASAWQPDGIHQPSAVFSPDRYAWSDAAWRGIPFGDLVLYELHVGTFTPEGTFDAVHRRLPELIDLGVTGIEIMPVAQFPGARNWGYDGVHPFAVQNSYGGPQSLQRLVDAAHGAGLAVILDVVYNHLGPEGNYLREFGPYFSDAHHTPWGPAVNVDGPQSDPVRQYFIDNACWWIREFHLDGLRLDAVQTIFDFSPRHLLADIQQAVQQVGRDQQRTVCVIAETNQNDVRLLHDEQRGGYGMDATWSDDLHHSVHALLTGEDDGFYSDYGRAEHVARAFEVGYAFDGCYSRYRQRRHGSSAADLPREQHLVSIQNHDQVGNRPGGERLAALVSPPAQRFAASLLLLSPFTPMLFMGEEYAESNPFRFFCSYLDHKLNLSVRRGRRRDLVYSKFRGIERLRPPEEEATFAAAVLSWSWQDDAHRSGLRRLYQDLLAARRNWPTLKRHMPPQCRVDANGLLTIRYPSDAHYHVLANTTGTEIALPTDAASRPAIDTMLLFSSEWQKYGGSRPSDALGPTLSAFEVVALGSAD